MKAGDRVMFFFHGWVTGTLLEDRTPAGLLRIQLDRQHGGGIAHRDEREVEKA